MKNLHVIFNFGFIWSFAASGFGFWQKICQPSADAEKSARKRTTSGTLGFQNYTKYGGGIDSRLGLLNKRHMIKNTELEFEHWTDIACDKLKRILFPPYIFIASRGRKWWTFCNLGVWFWPNFRENRPMREKTLGNTNLVGSCHTERKILTPHSNFACNEICAGRCSNMHFVRLLLYCWHGNAECLLVAPNLNFHPETVVKSAKCVVLFLQPIETWHSKPKKDIFSTRCSTFMEQDEFKPGPACIEL